MVSHLGTWFIMNRCIVCSWSCVTTNVLNCFSISLHEKPLELCWRVCLDVAHMRVQSEVGSMGVRVWVFNAFVVLCVFFRVTGMVFCAC